MATRALNTICFHKLVDKTGLKFCGALKLERAYKSGDIGLDLVRCVCINICVLVYKPDIFVHLMKKHGMIIHLTSQAP